MMPFPWIYYDPRFTTKLSNRTDKFPHVWEEKQPTIDKYVLEELDALEREIQKLKEQINKLK